MKIWVVRHGQTELNRKKRMQTYTDAPLNETGIAQAETMREKLSDVKFDAVYASHLSRAVVTASIIGGIPEERVIKDDRLTEVNFGKYEGRGYFRLGIPMSLHWLLPETFRAPKTVESIPEVRERVQSFLKELAAQKYENVLICSHGNLLRVLTNELEYSGRKITWKDFLHNCEIREFEINSDKEAGDFR